MTSSTIAPVELAALIASRVCHDVISPVGAINNGLEVLDEESDPSMRDFAMDLIRKSARQASAKLQFSRLAFGASGGAGSHIDMQDAGRIATELLSREKVELKWNVASSLLPKAEAKILLNLLLLAANTIARGGVLTVEAAEEGGVVAMRIVAEGDRARLPEHVRDVLTGASVPDPLDAHSVQPLYAVLLAEEAGLTFSIAEEEGRIVLSAAPRV
ncbi:histidine phosphotransferase ChpT [Afifella sp. IM 167]|uniref:histidine phosphotransferase ChpT n=1 Tax=Afifella sp. IM 167 TaxID=2033586 RepID=UPI001CC98E29|nr:histidine phosphotransferase family protein [Afifella sp. IM 167]MBZ8132114.1 histidine phosphotransferase [Afifella sp. IM 167]